MVNTIKRKTFEGNFDDLISDFSDFTRYEHRRGSTFHAKALIEINSEYFPELDRELDGTWETNDFIHSEEDFDKQEIHTLHRVKQVEETITIKKWVKVE